MNSNEYNESDKLRKERLNKLEPDYKTLMATIIQRKQRARTINKRNSKLTKEPYALQQESYALQQEPEPEPEQEYDVYPMEVLENIFNIHPDIYPTIAICEKVKIICESYPKYCKDKNYKKRYWNICKEIKKTNILINEFKKSDDNFNDSDSDDLDFLDDYTRDYPANTYIDMMEYDKSILQIIKNNLGPYIVNTYNMNLLTHIYHTDVSWHQLIEYLQLGNIDTFLYNFGVELYHSDPTSIIVEIERLKQNLLKEHMI